jgi:F0F1-type ATP synthase assembly protein I
MTENDENEIDEAAQDKSDGFFQPPQMPETQEETARKSGLAFSIGIAFFGSVLVMLGIGWLVDLWLKTAPWGIVVGIVLGSIIGFYQLVKTLNQINRPK